MNKLEYLNQLETILKKQHMTKADIDDIIRDYAEFFEEGRRQGSSDGEICAKLGSPELIAQQILEENGHSVSLAPPAAKSEFKMPDFKLPKFGFKESAKESSEKNTDEKREKKVYHKNCSGNLGCIGGSLLLLVKLFALVVVGSVLALVFGCGAAGFACAFVGLICAFLAVICCFFAASLVTHFLTLPVTIFAICLCLALLSLIVCIGALLLMLMGSCGKLFLSILRGILDWTKNPMVVSVPSAQQPQVEKEEEETNASEEEIAEQEGELYE